MRSFLPQQLARARTVVLALAVLSSGANCASSGEREAEKSATRQGPDAAGSASVAPRWRTEVDTLADTVVVRTGVATDAETEIRLIEELRIGEADEQDERVLGDARFVADSLLSAEFAKDSLGSITVGVIAGSQLAWTRRGAATGCRTERSSPRSTTSRAS